MMERRQGGAQGYDSKEEESTNVIDMETERERQGTDYLSANASTRTRLPDLLTEFSHDEESNIAVGVSSEPKTPYSTMSAASSHVLSGELLFGVLLRRGDEQRRDSGMKSSAYGIVGNGKERNFDDASGQ